MESNKGIHVIKPVCSMCGDKNGKGRHHLTPRQYGGEDTRTIPICKYCHIAIHQKISNRKLLLKYNSLSKLLAYKVKYGLSRLPPKKHRKVKSVYDIFKIKAKDEQKLRKEQERLKEIENEIREEQKLYEAEQLLKIMRNGK